MTDKKAVERRDFIKATSAALAGLASSRFFAGLPSDAAPLQRPNPQNPVVLRSRQVELVLDRRDGLPFEFRLLVLRTTMRGEDLGGKIAVTLCRLDPWTFATALLTVAWVDVAPSQADFHFEAKFDGQPASSFTVRYVVEDSTVFVSLESIVELSGYELIEVAMPRLVTVREEDSGAWLAHGDSGGVAIPLNKAKAGHLPPNTFWGNVLASLPVVMLGTNRALCVQEVTAYMDGTELTVTGEPGKRRASLGTVQVHRVNGGLCYDLNLGEGKPLNCGNYRTPNQVIEQKSSSRLDFAGDVDGDGAIDWLDGAKLVRNRMPAISTHYYDERLMYEIGLDRPRWLKAKVTFRDAIKPIHDFAVLTDYMPQIVVLWGWQYQGTDTGYPAVAEVNERVGTYGDLIRLMAEARQYDCAVTLSDNYDDAYKSSPAWDPAIIARRPDGGLWESRNWSGENSYIIGMAKYMQGPGEAEAKGPGIERTKYTCERYELRDTIYVDVLSYYSIRNDWDRQYPASGVKNLVDGRYRVLDEFKAYGVDVMSEALRYAFIGKVSRFGYAQQPLLNPFTNEPLPDPFGGEQVPMLPTIYRKSAIWGNSGKTNGPRDALLKTLFYNGCVSSYQLTDFGSDPQTVTDWVYIYMLPWTKVRGRDIESFRRTGDRTVIGLEGGGKIDLDWQKQTYSVTVGEMEIARNGSTFCPVDAERIAFYSLEPTQLSARLPDDWNAQEIAAIALSLDKPRVIQTSVKSGRVSLSVPARQPVMVYRNGANAKRRILNQA